MKLGAIFRGLSTAVMMLFMIGGMILYLTTGDMIVSFKPAVSFEDMLDENSEGMKAGQHVKGMSWIILRLRVLIPSEAMAPVVPARSREIIIYFLQQKAILVSKVVRRM